MGRPKPIIVSLTLVVLAAVALPVATAAKKTQSGLELRSRLPKDPVLAIVMHSEDLPASLDHLLETAARLSDDISSGDLQESLTEWESGLGVSVRDDLLAQLGPEFALVIDLPTSEELMNAVGDPTSENWSRLFRGIGTIANVRDAERLDGTLRKVLTAWNAEIAEAEELTQVTFSLNADDGTNEGIEPAFPSVPLYYGFRGETFALGFSPDWVRASLGKRASGERLDDGADFARLTSHLDERPTGLFYLNLPKIADWIRQSPLARLLIAGNEDGKRMAEVFLSDEYVGMGLAATTIEADGGVKTTSFGPPGLAPGRLIRAVVAAVTIPRLLSTIERGKEEPGDGKDGEPDRGADGAS